MATIPHTGRSFKAVVIDALVDDIVSAALPPGEKLSESRLAKRFGTSRMPVREALIELDRRGMVKVVPQVGTFVVEVTPERVLLQFEVREALEVEAARLAASRRDDAALAALQHHIDEMQSAVEEGSSRRYVESNSEFHATIFEAARNETLKEQYRSLMDSINREYIALIVSRLEGRKRRSQSEHLAVFEAIRDRDATAADAAMRMHVCSGKLELEQAFSEREAQEAL